MCCLWKGCRCIGESIWIRGKEFTSKEGWGREKWTDSEGKEKFSTEVIVDNFIFLDQRSQSNENWEELPEATHPVVEDEEVPF